jgi:hypothetical protein
LSEARIPRFAVIPSRPQTIDRIILLERCLNAIAPQVDQVFVIDNTKAGTIGVGPVPEPLDNVTFIHDPVDPVNLSQLWNMGLSQARVFLHNYTDSPDPSPKWDVAILNDDAIVPPGWFDAVSSAMRGHGGAAGCSRGPYVRHRPLVHLAPQPVNLFTRMTGWAFILAGEKGARANEQLKWWFGDDHLDWLSRQLGGVVAIPGFWVEHLAENGQVTPELQEQIAKDAAAFVAYWGMRPW